jgi:hypothetical protein
METILEVNLKNIVVHFIKGLSEQKFYTFQRSVTIHHLLYIVYNFKLNWYTVNTADLPVSMYVYRVNCVATVQ